MAQAGGQGRVEQKGQRAEGDDVLLLGCVHTGEREHIVLCCWLLVLCGRPSSCTVLMTQSVNEHLGSLSSLVPSLTPYDLDPPQATATPPTESQSKQSSRRLYILCITTPSCSRWEECKRRGMPSSRMATNSTLYNARKGSRSRAVCFKEKMNSPYQTHRRMNKHTAPHHTHRTSSMLKRTAGP